MRSWRNWLIGMMLAGLATAAEAQVVDFTIHPPAPRPFELVTLRFKTGLCLGIESRVTRVGADFVVTLFTDSGILVCLPSLDVVVKEFRLGAFPAGTYAVNVVSGSGMQYPMLEPTRLEFTVGAPAAPPSTIGPPTDYSGHWWNSGESGWGLSIHQSASNQMVLVLYLHDEAGRPVWYHVPGGTWINDEGWTGTLYRTQVSPLPWNFDPSRVERVVVGSVRLDFFVGPLPSDPNPWNGEPFARLTYEIDGVTHYKNIRKMQF